MPAVRRATAIDLFSGCGGLSLGLRQAGYQVVGAVEIDPLAAEAYRANHPSTFLWDRDICSLPMTEVLRRLSLRKGELDLLAGCPPCQGFSSLRTLNGARGMDDARNELIFEFLRFVKGLRPKTILLENVPGLAKDSRLDRLIGELDELGYKAWSGVADAAEFGIPQRRRRALVMAGRQPIAPPPIPNIRRTVRDAIGSLRPPGESKDPLHNRPRVHSPRILDLIRRIPKNGGSRLDLGIEAQLPCHRRSAGFYDIYGRMAWDDVAPTITGGCVNPSKGRFLHPDQDRVITLREAALLQGFPNRYVIPLRKGIYAAAELIGNAFPPEFARRPARALREQLDV